MTPYEQIMAALHAIIAALLVWIVNKLSDVSERLAKVIQKIGGVK